MYILKHCIVQWSRRDRRFVAPRNNRNVIAPPVGVAPAGAMKKRHVYVCYKAAVPTGPLADRLATPSEVHGT
jgi:hypothetical protein